MIREAIQQVVEGNPISLSMARSVMDEMMSGLATSSQIASFITAMRMKGETEEELLGFATAMRERSTKIRADECAVDLCGTGGDGLHTFNISTVSSFVVAACGVPVAKHGNKSVSSRSGSADLLDALGMPYDFDSAAVERCLREANFGFMFAPIFHSSMKNVSVPRREIGVRTFFNILGPMTNPACVKNQLIGVYDFSLASKMVSVLEKLGAKRIMLVNGQGMDEISIQGKSQIVELSDHEVVEYSIEPEMFGFNSADIDSVRGGDPAENARIALRILNGEKSPRHDIVSLNAGAALYISGQAENLESAVKIASKALMERRAMKQLENYSSIVREIEMKVQIAIEPVTLTNRKILPEILCKRSAEIARALIEDILKSEDGKRLLDNLNQELIRNPNVLTVLALDRIRQLPNCENKVIQKLPKSNITLSDSIESSEGIAVIGEYKPRSPSSSYLCPAPLPEMMADVYSSSGLAGVSVLVESNFFSGSTDLFSLFRNRISLPMLFKDIVISEQQLKIAKEIGADSVLLIAKALSKNALQSMIEKSFDINIEPVLEIHDENDLQKIMSCDSYSKVRLIGINSRNLGNLDVDLLRLPALRSKIADDKIVIAESGVKSPKDLEMFRDFDAVLIGSYFMKASNPNKTVKEMTACAGAI
ncbi:MAG: anthranilate phosphoribosyltransferase [Thermoplasmata archaeon]|nr:anthranilate phosphoribosyltransferase [Thermoplasmata archaeon]